MNTRAIAATAFAALVALGSNASFAFDEFAPKDVPVRPSAWELQMYVANGYCDRINAWNAEGCGVSAAAPGQTAAIDRETAPRRAAPLTTGASGKGKAAPYLGLDPHEFGLAN